MTDRLSEIEARELGLRARLRTRDAQNRKLLARVRELEAALESTLDKCDAALAARDADTARLDWVLANLTLEVEVTRDMLDMIAAARDKSLVMGDGTGRAERSNAGLSGNAEHKSLPQASAALLLPDFERPGSSP